MWKLEQFMKKTEGDFSTTATDADFQVEIQFRFYQTRRRAPEPPVFLDGLDALFILTWNYRP